MIPKVKIKFTFRLSRKLGKTEVAVKGKNFEEIIHFLKKESGNIFSQLFNEDGTFRNPYVFLLNGKVMPQNELYQREFKDKDTLKFFLPLAGG